MRSKDRTTPYPISPFIREQVPEWVRSDHETFVDFLEAYYEWLETDNGVVQKSGILQDLNDIDDALESFFEYFKNQYLFNFPTNLAIDRENGTLLSKEVLVKNIKQFYGAKGTERSYKFLFRVLYDAYSELYYPKKDMIRVSDGKWIQEKSIKVTVGSGNDVLKMVTRQVRQKDKLGNVTAYARVNRVIRYRQGQYSVAELFINDIYGAFIDGETVECTIVDENGDEKLIREIIYTCLTGISVQDDGSNYVVDEKIKVVDDVFGSGAEAFIKATTPRGGLRHIDLTNFGVGYNKTVNPQFTVQTSSGISGNVTGEYGALCEYPGYWTNNDGKTSSNKKIQDSYYYQIFSYVIKTEVTLDVFKKTVKDLIHPAGMEMFGSILLLRAHKVPLENRAMVLKYEIPLLGHYTPYTFKTHENLRNNSAGADLYPCGHNPTTGPSGPSIHTDEFESGKVVHSPSGPRLGDSMEEDVVITFASTPSNLHTGDALLQVDIRSEITGGVNAITGGNTGGFLITGLSPGYAFGTVTGMDNGGVVHVEVLSNRSSENYHFRLGGGYYKMTGGYEYLTGPWRNAGGTGPADPTNWHQIANVTGASGSQSMTGNWQALVPTANQIGISGALSKGEWSGQGYWRIYPHPAHRNIKGITFKTGRTLVQWKFNQPYESGNDYIVHEIVTQGKEGQAGFSRGHVVSWTPNPAGHGDVSDGLRGSVLVVEEVEGKFQKFGGVRGADSGAVYNNLSYVASVTDPIYASEFERSGDTTPTQFKHIMMKPFLRILKEDIFDTGVSGNYITGGVTGEYPQENTCSY